MATRNDLLLGWLKTATDDDVEATGTTRGYLRQIGYGNKVASAETAAFTETASCGVVTRQSLRPDDWQQIWPELAGDVIPPACATPVPIVAGRVA